MSQPELLNLVVSVLDDCEIEYMLTGSIASSLQGQPRSTHDIDFVVAMQAADSARLLSAFPPPEFYLSEEAIHQALERRSMFNLLSTREGDKADFWQLTDEPFDQSRFSRRIVEAFGGMNLRVSAPEDTILAKLSWAQRSGGSERHFVDALSVYEVQRETLDERYLDHWSHALDVASLLSRVRSQAKD